MKFSIVLIGLLTLTFGFSVKSADDASTEPLTKLPLPTATAPLPFPLDSGFPPSVPSTAVAAADTSADAEGETIVGKAVDIVLSASTFFGSMWPEF